MTQRKIENFEHALFSGLDAPAPGNKAQTKRPAADNAGAVEPLMSISEAAAALGISRRWIDDAINSGKLQYYSLTKRARKVRISEINELLKTTKKSF